MGGRGLSFILDVHKYGRWWVKFHTRCTMCELNMGGGGLSFIADVQCVNLTMGGRGGGWGVS